MNMNAFMHLHADDDKNNEIPFSFISMSPHRASKILNDDQNINGDQCSSRPVARSF